MVAAELCSGQLEVVRAAHHPAPHAHEVECIGKGKAHAPYEFGVKVSVATTLKRSKGGQFALHAKALPGNPYDGHTLASVIADMEEAIGNEISRILADAGYRGHNAPESHTFRVFTSGQKRSSPPSKVSRTNSKPDPSHCSRPTKPSARRGDMELWPSCYGTNAEAQSFLLTCF